MPTWHLLAHPWHIPTPSSLIISHYQAIPHPLTPLPQPLPGSFLLEFLKISPLNSTILTHTGPGLFVRLLHHDKEMGLSPYSNPSDAGVLCVILVNTAISLSIMKETVCSILQTVGFRVQSPNQTSPESNECRESPPETYIEEFRSRTPSLRYMSLRRATKQECSVCLTEFKPDAEINKLSCGHVFHKLCLENWLKHWNITCPLCRNHMMVSKEMEENTCPI